MQTDNLASTESGVGAKWTLKEHTLGEEQCPTGWWTVTTDNGECFDMEEPTARRIVTAVNAHEELVDVVNLLVMGRELMDAGMLLDENSPLIDAARTILAKLKS